MKKAVNKKLLLSIFSLMLIVAMAFSGCGKTDGNTTTTTTAPATTVEAISEVGQGEKAFIFKVVEKDGSTVEFKVNTDAKTVGEALVENGLIEGNNDQYGLMVHTVNGQKYEFTTDKMYWAFYINDEYAMTGVDSTEIDENAVYTFKAEKA